MTMTTEATMLLMGAVPETTTSTRNDDELTRVTAPSPLSKSTSTTTTDTTSFNSSIKNKNNYLRYDYTNLSYTSNLAKAMYVHNSQNCHLPMGNFIYRNRFGLGSDLHVYTQAICNSMQLGVRIRTVGAVVGVGASSDPDNTISWTYYDQDTCSQGNSDASLLSSSTLSNSNSSSNSSSAIVSSPMLCYFPQSELQCGSSDYNAVKLHPTFTTTTATTTSSSSTSNTMTMMTATPITHNISKPNGRINNQHCHSILQQYNASLHDVRTAGIEYLFSRISPLVVEEANRQLVQVFFSRPRKSRNQEQLPKNNIEKIDQDQNHHGDIFINSNTNTNTKTTPTSSSFQEEGVVVVPENIILVHVRWGDKKDEMKLVPMIEYIQAIQQLLKEKPRNQVNILLATEDPTALDEFFNLAAPYMNQNDNDITTNQNWNVYVDQYYYDMIPYRINEYNGNPKMSKFLKGKAGLKALGSLLVCLEATDYILTTSSNWSRLINELRISILNPRCNDCTTMIDLQPIPTNKEW